MTNFSSMVMTLALMQMLSQLKSGDSTSAGGKGQRSSRGGSMAGMMGMMGAGLLGTRMMSGMGGGSSLMSGLLGGMGGRGGRASMLNNAMDPMLNQMSGIGGMRGMRGGKKGQRLELPSVKLDSPANEPKKSFQLALRLPGYRRYRAPMSKGTATLLQDNLSKLPFLDTCQMNANTGSLKFAYEATKENEAAMDQLAAFLQTKIFHS